MTAPVRQGRRSLLVLAGDGRPSHRRGAQLLADALQEAGLQIIDLGQESSGREIARRAADEGADGIELCLAGAGGIALLRSLIKELAALNRHQVGIVVHRIR